MPFQHSLRPFTRVEIESISPNQAGVYGIFTGLTCVYVGKGDIRDRLLAHFNGDNPCIAGKRPNQWTGEVMAGDPSSREKQLIIEYNPPCNKRIG